MAEPKQKTKPPRKKAEPEKPRTSGVGALLREERRNRSLDIREVARSTRLREHFVEAIEQEAWDRLPPPVFVRGFIRSYARALGLDAARILELYDQSGPAEQAEPRPLQEPEPPGRGRRILLLLLLGILAGVLLYLWQGNPAPDWPGTPSAPTEPTDREMEPPVREPIGPENPPAPPEPPAGFSELSSERETPAAAERAPEPALSPPERSSSPPPEPEETIPGQDTVPAETEPPGPVSPREEATVQEERTLTIDVAERTWVQISVDGGEPKDFIFQPGSRPRWKDGESYELLIGNAAGVVVHFNGNTLKNLGKPGQVVRLTLPRDLESRDRGEP
ncbi:MAG: helix-turn-helix domain-containing protein [Deltaproteobacteria bacterium]|nr:helix-turn-helix domain-containing protein [Deltaproteobacteria bacterium]